MRSDRAVLSRGCPYGSGKRAASSKADEQSERSACHSFDSLAPVEAFQMADDALRHTCVYCGEDRSRPRLDRGKQLVARTSGPGWQVQLFRQAGEAVLLFQPSLHPKRSAESIEAANARADMIEDGTWVVDVEGNRQRAERRARVKVRRYCALERHRQAGNADVRSPVLHGSEGVAWACIGKRAYPEGPMRVRGTVPLRVGAGTAQGRRTPPRCTWAWRGVHPEGSSG